MRTPHRFLFSTLALSLALSTVACKSEIDDKPKAKVEDAAKVDDKAAAKADDKADDKAGDSAPAGDAKTLTLADGSSVGFIGAKLTGDHKGGFDKLEGSATLEGGKLSGLTVTIDMDSMTSDAEDLTGHLKSPDFFNVAEHPKASFTLTSASDKPGEGGTTHELVGNLELKGVAKQVTFPATVSITDAGVHGKAEFSINRKDWAIDYPGKPDDLIKDDVALILDLNFE